MPNATFLPQNETGKLELLEHVAVTLGACRTCFTSETGMIFL